MKTYETIINLGDMKLEFRATLPDDAVVKLDTREATPDAIDAVVAAADKQGVKPEIIVTQQPAPQPEIKLVNQPKSGKTGKHVLKVASEKVCRECGKTYKPTGNAQVYCPACKPTKVVVGKVQDELIECKSCGRLFFPYQDHKGLCNPHCKPLTDEQKKQQADMLRTGNVTLNQVQREN